MTTKVFVGNLSFKIDSNKLRDEFNVAGDVVSANIITRGPRSLGYGFVEFASREDAEKSVQLLNHKDIDGREINVEVAKPRADPPPASENEEGDRPARRRNKRRGPKPQQEGQPPQRPQQQTQQGGPSGRRPAQGQAPAPRRQYRPRYQNQDNSGNGNDGQVIHNNAGRNNNNAGRNNNNTNDEGQSFPRRNRRRRQPQSPTQQPAQFQRKRPVPQPKKQQERVASSTTLFVANLPFAVDDKELSEIFSKNLKVVSAKVVKKRNGRSKGFGFVEYENEADQQAALKEFDGATVHERQLNVKVALTALPGEEGEEGEAEKPEQVEEAAPAEGKKEAEAAKVEPAKEAKADAATPAEGEKKGQ